LFIFIIILGVAGFTAYVRIAPIDAALIQVDPETAGVAGGEGRFIVRPKGGDVAAPVFSETPEALLARFSAIALATPRTKIIAGSLAERRITYVTRSAFWGFPDYTTVAALPVSGGATLAIYARLRFGGSDLGVNKARVLSWLDALQAGQ
jgi:hypothetical protein